MGEIIVWIWEEVCVIEIIMLIIRFVMESCYLIWLRRCVVVFIILVGFGISFVNSVLF